jgi:hypothetical protein
MSKDAIRASGITQEKLKQIISYDPSTGHFTWLVRRSWRVLPGMRAGTINSSGHRQINIGKCLVLAHRLAWFYMTGKIPNGEIDHKNRNRDDNRWDNIRESTRSTNCANKEKPATNTSGFKGVSLHKRTGKWQATVKVNGKVKYIGMFADKVEAAAAYAKAANEAFGEFACTDSAA